MKPLLTIVAAVARNNIIGDGQGLPWNLPDDWNRLQTIVQDQDVVMGRNTFQSRESFLTRGRNFIMSTKDDLHLPKNCIQIHRPGELLERASGEVFVLGGGQLYASLLPYTQRMLLTEISADVKGKTYFPEINREDWDLLSSVYHPRNDNHPYGFYFNEYVRRSTSQR